MILIFNECLCWYSVLEFLKMFFSLEKAIERLTNRLATVKLNEMSSALQKFASLFSSPSFPTLGDIRGVIDGIGKALVCAFFPNYDGLIFALLRQLAETVFIFLFPVFFFFFIFSKFISKGSKRNEICSLCIDGFIFATCK